MTTHPSPGAPLQGLLDVLQQSSDLLTGCQITADGRRMAVGYADGTVRLWTLGLNVSQVCCCGGPA